MSDLSPSVPAVDVLDRAAVGLVGKDPDFTDPKAVAGTWLDRQNTFGRLIERAFLPGFMEEPDEILHQQAIVDFGFRYLLWGCDEGPAAEFDCDALSSAMLRGVMVLRKRRPELPAIQVWDAALEPFRGSRVRLGEALRTWGPIQVQFDLAFPLRLNDSEQVALKNEDLEDERRGEILENASDRSIEAFFQRYRLRE